MTHHLPALRLLLGAALITTTLTACDSCKNQPETPDLATPPAPDLAVVETPDLGNDDALKEATEAAEKEAELRAVATGDMARLVAAEIEAANKPTEKVDKGTKARIKVDEPAETGSIDPKDANNVFRRFDGAMKKCYERALKRSPGLEGKVELMVVVKPDGTVRRSKASGLTLQDESVSNCMEALTPRMKFPAPNGGAARLKKVYVFTPAL